jgi:serine/threonine protein phosphatase PrpC
MKTVVFWNVALMMEAVCSSEPLVNIYQITWATSQKTTIFTTPLRKTCCKLIMCSSGFWRGVDSLVDVNVSEKHTVSIFRAEDLKMETVYTATSLHNAKTHKNIIIILTAVKTSNLSFQTDQYLSKSV